MTEMQTCSTCRWWKESELYARRLMWEASEWVQLGYCGCETAIPLDGINAFTGAAGPKLIVKNRGMTAEDYHCPEWKEKGDG